jgi:pimeloyl-ACP methyl ester carboxylesterase
VRRLKTALLGSTVAVAAVGTLTATSLASAASAAPTARPQAGASTAGGTAATTTTASGLKWGACASASLTKAGAVCAMLSVPLDYAKPHGKKIQIAVSMIKHKATAKYQGIMLVNPGGPGGSGLGLAVLGQYVPNNAGDGYDWIGFDPRGVGSSKPALTCDPNYFKGPRPLYEPVTKKLETTWLARSKAYAKACGRNGGDLLPHLTTIDSARDMNSIRVALGQKQINYYGFSYGTYLGQVYATLYPKQVRRMVLDSNVDPRKVWYQANLDQDVAFEKNMKIWFAWVAKYDSVYHLGTTGRAVEARFYAEKLRLLKKPAGGQVGPDEWTDIFLPAGYYQQTWEDLASLWSAWNKDHKDAQPLVDAANDTNGVGDDNGFAMYLGVQCVDTQWPKSWAKWRADNWRTFRKAPFETWGNAWFNAPCLFWPAKASKPVNVNGSKVKAGILLIDETLDAATPYPGSLEVRRRFPTSSLIALPGGTSHANSLYGNACEDDQIAAYLATGTLPARKPGNRADTTCAPLPVPDPTAPAAAASSSAAGSAAAARTAGAAKEQLAAGRRQLALIR